MIKSRRKKTEKHYKMKLITTLVSFKDISRLYSQVDKLTLCGYYGDFNEQFKMWSVWKLHISFLHNP